MFSDRYGTINNMGVISKMTQASAIIFSTSLNMRNSLRSLVNESGFNAVCFENEAICFDNLVPIQPKMVIADIETIEVVWRFVFALYALNTGIPLVVVSDQLQAGMIENEDMPIKIHAFARHKQSAKIKNTIKEIAAKSIVENDSRYPRQHLMVGQCKAIATIRYSLMSIADTRDPVLIVGEKGTGKELLARIIFGLNKQDVDFVKINCAEITHDMLVNGGLNYLLAPESNGQSKIIFLDRVDKLSIDCQACMYSLMESLLKQENKSSIPDDCSTRFIATSEFSIDELVGRGEFRKDLYYSLNVIPIEMPSLRARKEDIPLLMDYFMITACIKSQKCVMLPSQHARDICLAYQWPGNIEELKIQIQRMVHNGSEANLLAHTRVRNENGNANEDLISHLADVELPKFHEIRSYLKVVSNISLKGVCNEFVAKTERRLLQKALESTSWNRKKAAELLNISYKSMLNKMKAYDIV